MTTAPFQTAMDGFANARLRLMIPIHDASSAISQALTMCENALAPGLEPDIARLSDDDATLLRDTLAYFEEVRALCRTRGGVNNFVMQNLSRSVDELATMFARFHWAHAAASKAS